MQNIGAGGGFRLAAALFFVTAVTAAAAAAQVSGKVTITEAGGKAATDVGNAVVYLEGRGPRVSPMRVEMTLDGRSFSPRVTVVPVGSVVTFPNRDPFNHNVFSVSEGNAFDLGLYGRGQKEEHRFRRTGVVSVYCNIHPRMVGFILVRDNPYFAQPGADGSFAIADVPPGRYTLHVWFERAQEATQEIVVPEGGGGLANLDVKLDASGYQYTQHKNKYGQEYGSGATRERY